MQRWGARPAEHGDQVCSECTRRFIAYRDRIFDKQPAVCSAECQKARKTRLQRERRHAKRHHIAST
jgi:hypothetical protein